MVFTSILIHIFLPSAVLTVPGTVRVVVLSLQFQPSIHKSAKLFGYSFAFDDPTLWNAFPDEIHASLS